MPFGKVSFNLLSGKSTYKFGTSDKKHVKAGWMQHLYLSLYKLKHTALAGVWTHYFLATIKVQDGEVPILKT